MKRISLSVILIACLIAIFAAAVQAAELAVIVNKNNAADVNKAMIEKIYSGDMGMWPQGGLIAPIDFPAESAERAAFATRLLGKSGSAYMAAWSIKLFSGKATPPKVMSSDDEVKQAVAGNKNAIGYIKSSSVDGTVKSVLTLK